MTLFNESITVCTPNVQWDSANVDDHGHWYLHALCIIYIDKDPNVVDKLTNPRMRRFLPAGIRVAWP